MSINQSGYLDTNAPNAVVLQHQTSEAESLKGLQFITITDPSESNIPKNKRIVRSQAMRHARKHVQSFPRLRRQGSSPPIFIPTCPRRLCPGPVSCICSLPGDVTAHTMNAEESKENGAIWPWYDSPVGISNRYHAPSPLSVLGAGHIDPFASFPIPMKPYMHFLVDYYARVTGRGQRPVGGVEAPLVSALIPLARSNATFLHCLLCLTASQLTLAQNITKPRPCEIYHRGEAFKLLRKALSDPEKATSDETVVSILTLSGHDVIFSLHKDHEAHMQGLDRIIAARGGVDNLGYDGLLKMILTWVQHYRLRLKPSGDLSTNSMVSSPYAKVRMRRPFPIMVYANVPLAPQGFRKLAKKGLVGIAFLRSINNLVFLIKEATETTQSKIEISPAFSERWEEIERDLENVRKVSIWDAESYLEDCCCIAVYIYYRTALPKMLRSPSLKMDLPHELIASLERARMHSCLDGEHSLLLWILFIGYATARTSVPKTWFATQSRELISLMQLNVDFSALRDILRQFLYSQKLYEKDYEEFQRTMTCDHEIS